MSSSVEADSDTLEAALDTVKRHMAAEDRQDVAAAVECFTEDCYYEVPGLDVRLEGKSEIAEWYERLFAAVPDFRNIGEHYWAVEQSGRITVFFESKFEGTHTSTWHGWAPTNRRFRSSMLVRIPIAADGLMEAEVVYEDSAHIFMQLGVLPELGSKSERALQAAHRLRMHVPLLR